MLLQFADKPFKLQLSFHKLIEGLEKTASVYTDWRGMRAIDLLKRVDNHPELKDGITSFEQITENEDLIADLLSELFPESLTHNEIKAISLPYQGLLFNKTYRLKQILDDAGPNFEINIRDFDEHQIYILSCCIILNSLYGTNLDFKKPLFYDIPTAQGVTKHYRILYNADFMEVLATDKSPRLTQAEIDELLDNYDNIELWKKKFPPGCWIVKGFAIMSMIDVTVENALSILKSNLLGNYTAPDVRQKLQSVFRSMFNIPDLRLGFTLFDSSEGVFSNAAFGLEMHSYLLEYHNATECRHLLSGESYKCIMQDQTFYAVSDVEELAKENPDGNFGDHFAEQNIKSFILAPAMKDGVLLGILELVSPRKKELNSVTANKLEIVMPFLVDTIDRKIHEMQNHLQAVIQDYYTTLHPSVYWKFRREAQNYIKSVNSGLDYTLKEITFKDIYPLYGQVDISDSSITRNLSVRNDLTNQLNQLIDVLNQLNKPGNTDGIEKVLADLQLFVDDLALTIRADTEQYIQHYMETMAYPILRQAVNHKPAFKKRIEDYFKHDEALTGDFHANRRDYDKTLSLINQKLATVLDNRQAEIQTYFPHYFERFKTDGIEHNIYIGASIAPKEEFKPEHLHRLRLWQLRVIAEMETEQFNLKEILPYPLGVTSLVLVFSTPIAIRFRMDEKHFDVDGAYNIRYEVIKKRIDKAHIKGTRDRITQQGKITIIYSKTEEEEEYIGYINILQAAGILAHDIEHFEVEDLQGVSGLKALRVGILHQRNLAAQRSSSYNELYKQLDQNLNPADI
jgi:hypothetical protein